ncbi:hypothetical protein Tco_1374215, partial [Tanacetum coccineum]
ILISSKKRGHDSGASSSVTASKLHSRICLEKSIDELEIILQAPPRSTVERSFVKQARHDSGTSGSSHPPAPQSSAWKSTATRDAPSSSSKQQSGPHSEQPDEDIPIPDTANISDLDDTDSAHLPKTKPRPEWLNPILEEDRPATPEPAWVIPTSHIPDAVNN